ncbi:hypothetical protein F2Q70_00014829 [Brassica cretica]|uniref:Uncharacterized protein n=1 Tax=Brassica cretica TaxID=69181 RepID=A0A8S9HSV0_BRACR|nr:hypothetical protein F2Q70_00014829 [Brassica cretica]
MRFLKEVALQVSGEESFWEMELDCFPSSDVDKKRSNTDSSQAEQNHKSAG